MRDIAAWVRAHHERVDGRGYPEGLSSDAISLEARILSVADSYEAMIADRLAGSTTIKKARRPPGLVILPSLILSIRGSTPVGRCGCLTCDRPLHLLCRRLSILSH